MTSIAVPDVDQDGLKDEETHALSYTPAGRIERYEPPALVDANGVPYETPTHYSYDLDGRLRVTGFPDGSEIERHYEDGRLEALVTPKITREYFYNTFASTGTNRLAEVESTVDNNFSARIEYDWDGRLLESMVTSYTPLFEKFILGQTYYDGDFSLKIRAVESDFNNISYPAHFTYDTDGLIAAVELPGSGGEVLTLVRDRAGDGISLSQTGTDTNTGYLVESNSFGAGKKYGYDEFGQLEAIEYPSATFEILERDALGRIIRAVEEVDGVQRELEYYYTPSGFLKAVEIFTDGNYVLWEYKYDLNGNRLGVVHQTEQKSVMWSASYDAQDRIQTYTCDKGSDACEIDENGVDLWPDYDFSYRPDLSPYRRTELQNSDFIEYDYDLFGNLRHVKLEDGLEFDYYIDPNDRRLAKHLSNHSEPIRGLVWGQNDRILAEFDEQGQIVSRFIYATNHHVPDLMYSNKIDNSWRWYRFVTDLRGSVRLVVEVYSGSIAQKLDYSPFGRVMQDTEPGFQPFGFAGGLYDPDAGLVRFGARDYDPLIGRWTMKDPIRFASGDTNLYGYVMQDPVNFVDPSGLAAMKPDAGKPEHNPQSDGPGWKTVHGAVCLWLAAVCKNYNSMSPCFTQCFPACMRGSIPSWDPQLCPLGDGDDAKRNMCVVKTE
jgi:RHS repeat-associated protein